VTDPDFSVDSLPDGLASSVTLTLEQVDERARLNAVRRFFGQNASYRRKRVWQGLTGLRFRKEMDLCISLQAPFLSGPLVSDMLSAPVVGFPCGLSGLPYRSTDKPATLPSLPTK
jgi:hypothetical protein